MDACGGHPAGRGLVGLQAPVVPVERKKLVVAEVGFDLVNPPQFAGVRPGQKVGDRRFPAPLVPHPENEARVATKPDGLLGAGLRQGQRLFAKHMLAGCDRGLDLLAMQRMRRGEHDGLHRGIGERIRVVRRQCDALFGANRARRLEVGLDGAHDADVRRRRAEHVQHLLAPPAHADERNSYGLAHSGSSSRLMREGGERVRRKAGRTASASQQSVAVTNTRRRQRAARIAELAAVR